MPRSLKASFDDLLKELKRTLADESRPKAVHNSKLLKLQLAKQGITVAGVADDTMLYSYLLEPLASSHALADVVLRRKGRKISPSLAEAAQRTHQLGELLRPEIAREKLQNLYREIELPLASVLAEVETAGMRIDAEILARMSGEFDKELTGLTHEIYDLAGGAFDIDSPKQLGEILFERLKLPGGKRLKKSGQYSTDASVLEALAEKHDLPRKIIELPHARQAEIDLHRCAAQIHSGGHGPAAHILQPNRGAHGAALFVQSQSAKYSHRVMSLACASAAAFVADPGHKLISADYSQIELRVLAHLSQDPLLMEAFTRTRTFTHARRRKFSACRPACKITSIAAWRRRSTME